MRSNKKLTTSEFIVKAEEVHGNKYDYSKVTYNRSHDKVIIICRTHGEFMQKPNSHISQKSGCPKCTTTVKSTKEGFIRKATETHGDKYCYNNVIYKNSKSKVEIICRTHGSFWQSASSHYLGRGKGCPHCSGNIPIKPDLSHIKTPKGSRAVPLTQGKYAIVDEEDFEKVMQHNWNFDSNGGYACGNSTRLHRFIINPPSSLEVDHINLDKLDNRKSNLRVCTRKQNSYNQPITEGRTSKYKGVYKQKGYCKWVSKIQVDGATIHLGSFNSEDEAARAYDTAALKYFKEYANVNYPVV